jgi:hypothetical protein
MLCADVWEDCLFHLHRWCKQEHCLRHLWKWNRVFRNVGTSNSGAGDSPKINNTCSFSNVVFSCHLFWQNLLVSSALSVQNRVKRYPVTGPEGPEGGRGIALLFLDLGTRRGWVVSVTPRPLYPRERPGTHCTGGWVGPRAGLNLCENLTPTGIRSPHRPARSQSL